MWSAEASGRANKPGSVSARKPRLTRDQGVASRGSARWCGMRISGEVRDQLGLKCAVLFPHLDERQRRLLMGAEARILGHGGIRAVAQAAEVSETTVRKGVDELEAGAEPLGRVRRPGGGRKRAAEVDAGLRPALLVLVEPDMRGTPMPPLRWTTKSTRRLADALTSQGHRISADTVAGLLRQEGFSLQANAKTLERGQHPDRDAQFRYINDRAKEHISAGNPVISVDTKKKELVGPYRNGPASGSRRELRPRSRPTTSWRGRDRARRSLTGSTTSPRTPAGSVSVPTTTPQPSPSHPSAAGGKPAAVTNTPRPPGC